MAVLKKEELRSLTSDSTKDAEKTMETFQEKAYKDGVSCSLLKRPQMRMMRELRST